MPGSHFHFSEKYSVGKHNTPFIVRQLKEEAKAVTWEGVTPMLAYKTCKEEKLLDARFYGVGGFR
jgi:hypothetical protein